MIFSKVNIPRWEPRIKNTKINIGRFKSHKNVLNEGGTQDTDIYSFIYHISVKSMGEKQEKLCS